MLKIISMVIDNYYRFRYYIDVASFVLLRMICETDVYGN